MQKCGTLQIFSAILDHKINKANMYTINKRMTRRNEEREREKRREEVTTRHYIIFLLRLMYAIYRQRLMLYR